MIDKKGKYMMGKGTTDILVEEAYPRRKIITPQRLQILGSPELNDINMERLPIHASFIYQEPTDYSYGLKVWCQYVEPENDRKKGYYEVVRYERYGKALLDGTRSGSYFDDVDPSVKPRRKGIFKGKEEKPMSNVEENTSGEEVSEGKKLMQYIMKGIKATLIGGTALGIAFASNQKGYGEPQNEQQLVSQVPPVPPEKRMYFNFVSELTEDIIPEGDEKTLSRGTLVIATNFGKETADEGANKITKYLRCYVPEIGEWKWIPQGSRVANKDNKKFDTSYMEILPSKEMETTTVQIKAKNMSTDEYAVVDIGTLGIYGGKYFIYLNEEHTSKDIGKEKKPVIVKIGDDYLIPRYRIQPSNASENKSSNSFSWKYNALSLAENKDELEIE